MEEDCLGALLGWGVLVGFSVSGGVWVGGEQREERVTGWEGSVFSEHVVRMSVLVVCACVYVRMCM